MCLIRSYIGVDVVDCEIIEPYIAFIKCSIVVGQLSRVCIVL